MPSPPPAPLAVDLDVLKLGTTEDPITLDDVERALYALTGWQKPQALVDAALDVVVAFAREVRAGQVAPRRDGHLVVACTRAHLDDHACPVTAKTVEVERLVDALDRSRATAPPLALAPAERAPLDQAATALPPSESVRRLGVRNVASMTPEQLVMDVVNVEELTPAQRAAREALLANRQRCSTCDATKPLTEFYRDKARLTGHASRCKDCANAATAARRRKTPQMPPIGPI